MVALVMPQDGSSPWHNWVFDLNTGEALGEDARIATYPVRIEAGRVLLDGMAVGKRSAA